MCYTDAGYTVIEYSMSSVQSFIPFSIEHLIRTRFVLLTISCLRMERERAKKGIPVLDLIVSNKE